MSYGLVRPSNKQFVQFFFDYKALVALQRPQGAIHRQWLSIELDDLGLTVIQAKFQSIIICFGIVPLRFTSLLSGDCQVAHSRRIAKLSTPTLMMMRPPRRRPMIQLVNLRRGMHLTLKTLSMSTIWICAIHSLISPSPNQNCSRRKNSQLRSLLLPKSL